MATLAEPTRDDAMADIKKIEEMLKATPELQTKINLAVLNATAHPDTSTILLKQVTDLGDGAKQVYDAFNKVSTGLAEVDENNYTDEHGKPLKKLKSEWDSYRERFIRLVWSSRDCAIETGAYALDFIRDYLPAIEEAIEIAKKDPTKWDSLITPLKADLKKFSEKPNPAQARSPRPVPPNHDPFTIAQAHSQDFLDLRDQISAFASTFASFAKFKEGELKGKIPALNAAIDALNRQMEEYSGIINKLGIAMLATRVGTALIAAGLVACLGPLGGIPAVIVMGAGTIAVIGEGAALYVYMYKKSETNNELKAKVVERDGLLADLKHLQGLQTKLQGQSTNVNTIISNLDKFANIWSSVAASAGEVGELLKSAATPDTESFLIVKNQVTLLKESYSNIYKELSLYTTHVADSGIPKPAQ
ncbi:hypothetical protein CTheo_4411 [Ceratobasidium theobromae]|uniref:Transmembrane protein n=1 Tax=Ceratobasidium theobromae TaxID=1582974 RepID=A0A5N5QLV0_9AGAM|nr:hypothetical protein CTheo_4411 [Ceratobasidium theobromae]